MRPPSSTRRSRLGQPLRRVALTLAVAAVLVVLAAAPAAAHAELLAETPAPGQVLANAPSAVTLSFSEPVEASLGAVRVFNTREERVDQGGVDQSGNTVRLPLPDLKSGSYVVTWRVTSADSHPVEGAFTFQVGAGGNATSRQVTGLAQRLLASTKGDQVVGAVFGALRWLVFASLALLLGALAFAAVILPSARASRRTRVIVWGSWSALAASTIAGILVYGPYAAGLGLGDAFKGSIIGDTFGLRFGEVWAARLGLLALLAVAIVVFLRRSDDGSPRPVPSWWASLALPTAVALCATPGLAGHAVAGDWQTAAVVADTIHVLAMAVWLGGLVMLAVVLLPGRHADELRAVLPRWSRAAAVCVAAIIATGAFQTWRQVGGLDALRSTDYGRILVVKIVLFSVLLVLAAFSRDIVLRLYPPARLGAARVPVVAGGADDTAAWDPDEAADLHRLRRSVIAEFAVAIALLAATALLVNAAPAKSVLAQGGGQGAVGTTLDSSKISVDISLTPGRKGRNDVHVSTIRPNGAPRDVKDLELTFALRDRKISPIDVPLRKLSPGHYLSPGFDVPFNGDWRVVAKPLLTSFDQATLTGTITIG